MSTTREDILRAATELFAQRGYGRTSIRQVAERANANSALIYYYFGSKGDLYRAVLREPALRLREMLEVSLQAESSASARLEHFVRSYVHFILTHVGLAALVFRSLAGGDVELTSAIQEQVAPNADVLTGIIREGIASGEFRPVDPSLAVGSLIGMVLFYVLAAPAAAPVLGVTMDQSFADRLAEHTIGIILDGLRA